jgi:hypothetical protein
LKRIGVRQDKVAAAFRMDIAIAKMSQKALLLAYAPLLGQSAGWKSQQACRDGLQKGARSIQSAMSTSSGIFPRCLKQHTSICWTDLSFASPFPSVATFLTAPLSSFRPIFSSSSFLSLVTAFCQHRRSLCRLNVPSIVAALSSNSVHLYSDQSSANHTCLRSNQEQSNGTASE